MSSSKEKIKPDESIALSLQTWSEFRVGDLYDASRPNARNKDDYEEGQIPFIASGAINNGVMKCCKPKEGEALDKGNCITVSPVDGSAFYQPMNFLGRGGAGSSVLMLRGDDLNFSRGQFIARMIQLTCSKYDYGHMGNQESIKRERIRLPVSSKGTPDYAFMERYVEEKRKALLSKYKTYLKQRITELGEHVEIPALEEKKWGTFTVGSLFSIYSGRDIYAQERSCGSTPYITSGSTNNGIGYFVGNDNDSRKQNVISVNRNGAVGEAFFHPYVALFGNDCRQIRLREEKDSEVYLFFTLCISTQKKAFGYSRKLGTSRLNCLKIMLPLTKTNTPDYSYMKQYMRNLLLRKYRQYLAYLESKNR